jgi:2-polyprenyl-6-methoxyphenol hydroxylase-like FAD-dependent oxidoreductase
MSSTHEHHDTDVLVVGARCAGAATALLLARAGHRVTVVDRATFPSDTISTHGLARGGVVLLDRWGLLDPLLATGAPPIHRITLHGPAGVVVAPIHPRAGVDLLLAPRRDVLDALVLDAAVQAGAVVHTGATVERLTRDGQGRVTGAQASHSDGRSLTFRSHMVVGADGLRSRVARDVGAPITRATATRGAAAYTYVEGLAQDGIEVHVADGRVAGLFPTHGGAVVWLSTPSAEAAGLRGGADVRAARWWDRLVTTAPTLAGRLAQATRTSPLRGARELPNHYRHPVGPGWALVGDAGLHRDPVTGHGMTDAYRDAELLAGAIDDVLRGAPDAEALAGYHRDRDALSAEVFEITTRMAEFPSAEALFDLEARLGRALDREAEQLAARPLPRRAPVDVPLPRAG